MVTLNSRGPIIDSMHDTDPHEPTAIAGITFHLTTVGEDIRSGTSSESILHGGSQRSTKAKGLVRNSTQDALNDFFGEEADNDRSLAWARVPLDTVSLGETSSIGGCEMPPKSPKSPEELKKE